jgi:cytosine/adenosine deaminase-related metal-dependent hydrolase
MKPITILGGYLIQSSHEVPKANWGLRIEGNRIAAMGPNAELRENHHEGELLDASGQIVMPGLINTHKHMYAMLAHGMPVDQAWSDLYYALVDWWWPKVEDQMDHEALRASSALASLVSIQSGVTTICDVMEAPYALPGALDVAGEVLDRAGMRAVLTFEATERVGPENADLGLEENARFIRENPTGKGRISGMMSIHTTFSCSLSYLKRARKLADELGSHLHMHISESRYEALHCLRTYQKLPFEVYDEIGFLGPDVLASQAVHVREREIPLIAERGVKLSHQPLSNAEPGCGVAPVPDYLAHGMTLGLGTDGLLNDHFEVMRGSILIQRAHRVDGTLMPPHTVFDMATASGARALGLEELGTLEVGNLADVVIMDADFSAPVSPENLLDLLVLYRGAADVNTVIIDGRIVMREREVLTLDEEQVKAEARRSARRVWEKAAA